ncbi:MAG: enoyl-CoA hydratase/isomerase family protein, partial [Acidimicrobiales bacterium]
GPAKAKELVLFGTRVDATEALRLGLVNAVTKDAMAQARTWALELAGRPRVALGLAKAALDRGPEGTIAAAYELEVSNSLALARTSEAIAAAEAFRRRHDSARQDT